MKTIDWKELNRKKFSTCFATSNAGKSHKNTKLVQEKRMPCKSLQCCNSSLHCTAVVGMCGDGCHPMDGTTCLLSPSFLPFMPRNGLGWWSSLQSQYLFKVFAVVEKIVFWFLENYVSKVSRVLRKAFQWGVLAQRGLPPANTCKWIGGLEEGALGGQCGEWASCQNSGFTSRRDWGELLVLWQATFKCKELSFQLHVWNVKVF